MRFIFAFALFCPGAVSAQSFTVTPASVTLAVQQDGTCRGHLEYRIVDAGVVDESGAPIAEIGVVEIKTACTKLTDITGTESFDTSGGKLTLSAPRVTISKTIVDVDGTGPRVAGDCDVTVTATATIRKVSREVTRSKPSNTCVPLANIATNSCWVARGSWHESAPFPAGIAKCP